MDASQADDSRSPRPGTPAAEAETVEHRTEPCATAAPGSGDAPPVPAGGRFVVLRTLARGGLGEVSVALDREFEREVALKEILHGRDGMATVRERFVQEAWVTGNLEHPGVVPVYSMGTHPDGRPFYVMRLIHGESLQATLERFHETHARLAEGSLELRDLLQRFSAVCQTVQFAHDRGVVHRDLKPSNIMLGPYGETLVVDWGLVKHREADAGAEAEGGPGPDSGVMTRAGSVLGTPQYMSPEQAAGDPTRVGPASDVYALGATLFAILTGRPPVPRDTTERMLESVRQGQVVHAGRLKPGVPRPLEAVCRKAMAREPADRYGSCRELAEDVQRWLADQAVSAEREPLLTQLGRWYRKQPLAAVYTSGCFLASAAYLLLLTTWVFASQTAFVLFCALFGPVFLAVSTIVAASVGLFVTLAYTLLRLDLQAHHLSLRRKLTRVIERQTHIAPAYGAAVVGLSLLFESRTLLPELSWDTIVAVWYHGGFPRGFPRGLSDLVRVALVGSVLWLPAGALVASVFRAGGRRRVWIILNCWLYGLIGAYLIYSFAEETRFIERVLMPLREGRPIRVPWG